MAITATTRLLPKSVSAPSARAGHRFAEHDGKVYSFGGGYKELYYNDIHVFDVEQMIWTLVATTGTPPAPRGYSGAAVHGDSLYIIGGDCRKELFGDVFSLNLRTLHWEKVITTGETFPKRTAMAVSVAGDCCYAVAGLDLESLYNEIWELNLPLRRWRRLDPTGDIVEPRSFPDLVTGHDGKTLYLYGGNSDVDGETNDHWSDCYTFDTQTHYWKRVKIANGHEYFRRAVHSMVYMHPYVVILGGRYEKTKLDQIVLWDINTNTFELAVNSGDSFKARCGFGCARISKNRLIVNGGSVGNTRNDDTLIVELHLPEDGTRGSDNEIEPGGSAPGIQRNESLRLAMSINEDDEIQASIEAPVSAVPSRYGVVPATPNTSQRPQPAPMLTPTPVKSTRKVIPQRKRPLEVTSTDFPRMAVTPAKPQAGSPQRSDGEKQTGSHDEDPMGEDEEVVSKPPSAAKKSKALDVFGFDEASQPEKTQQTPVKFTRNPEKVTQQLTQLASSRNKRQAEESATEDETFVEEKSTKKTPAKKSKAATAKEKAKEKEKEKDSGIEVISETPAKPTATRRRNQRAAVVDSPLPDVVEEPDVAVDEEEEEAAAAPKARGRPRGGAKASTKAVGTRGGRKSSTTSSDAKPVKASVDPPPPTPVPVVVVPQSPSRLPPTKPVARTPSDSQVTAEGQDALKWAEEKQRLLMQQAEQDGESRLGVDQDEVLARMAELEESLWKRTRELAEYKAIVSQQKKRIAELSHDTSEAVNRIKAASAQTAVAESRAREAEKRARVAEEKVGLIWEKLVQDQKAELTRVATQQRDALLSAMQKFYDGYDVNSE